MLKIINLSVKINKKTILHPLSLDIKAGEQVSILGQNGSGKTTLLKAITGSLKHTGTITLNGKNIAQSSAYQRAHLIGYIQQHVDQGTIGHMTVEQNMLFALKKKHNLCLAYTKKSINCVHDIIKTAPLTLNKRLKQRVDSLSGGQRQLLALLMVMQKDSSLFLMDEITAALDPNTAQSVAKEVNQILGKRNSASIAVTHDLAHALQYSTRIIILHSGYIAHDITDFGGITKADLINMF
ncbi:MAG: ATP-binding cassette domain-containing protein [Alphaproteobacteria bacterium]|nr:ATP-binding cassette domain-containing protein [Alphaproteobacteria bacterium]